MTCWRSQVRALYRPLFISYYASGAYAKKFFRNEVQILPFHRFEYYQNDRIAGRVRFGESREERVAGATQSCPGNGIVACRMIRSEVRVKDGSSGIRQSERE